MFLSPMDTCAGLALLNKVNMAKVTLIPPNSQSIVTANKSMHIMGAVMVQIKAKTEGKKKFTMSSTFARRLKIERIHD